jgi:hypothetical protein
MNTNTESVKTGNFILAAAVASVDPLRTVIEIEPVPGATDWQVNLIVTCPRARELWAQLHPGNGQPVVPIQSNPVSALAINQEIFRTSARLRDGASTETRINCYEVCNG